MKTKTNLFVPVLLCTIAVFTISCGGSESALDPNIAASSKAITAFSITSPVTATGIINETNHTIAVAVPFGTNVTALVPAITHTGASVSPASGVAQNFTGSVTYTVTAADGTKQAYLVTVTVGAADAKAITAFSITSPVTATGVINETNHTIAVAVPFGTNVTALVPAITHTGASISPGSGVPRNFTGSVTYTVTAADNSIQTYTVTVTFLPAPKAITAFTFPTSIVTTITEATHSIAVTVPYGTDRNGLVPTITISPGASISPASGVARNFTGTVTYTVTGADTLTQVYTVTVTVALNSAKAITAFTFPTSTTTTITEATHTVAVSVPNGTNVTALVPAITHTGANVSPASGVAQNFSGPQTYRVTAADTSFQDYVVTVYYLAAVTTTEIAGNLIFTVDIAGTSAKGGGNVTNQGSSPVTERGLCWNTSPNPTIANSYASDGLGTGVFTNVSIDTTILTTYYVRAYATNDQGTAYGNQINFYSGRTIGTEYQEGYVFYNDGWGHGLASDKIDLPDFSVWIEGGTTQTTLNGTTSTAIGTGLTNSDNIKNQPGHTGSAALLCLNHSVGLYGDWYLPSRDELNLMHDKLYLFGIGGFAGTFMHPEYYWSSSEIDNNEAYRIQFGSGPIPTNNYKSYIMYVRAIRSF